MMSMDTLALVGLSINCWVSFAWAIVRHFTRPSRPSRLMQVVALCGMLFGGWQLWAVVETRGRGPVMTMTAVVFYVSSLGVYWWAVHSTRTARLPLAFSQARPGQLVMEGPYRWVRHPFYVSYLLYWVAGVFAAQAWPLLLSVIVMGTLYRRAASQEEAEMLQSDQADTYRDYAGRVGRFIPSF